MVGKKEQERSRADDAEFGSILGLIHILSFFLSFVRSFSLVFHLFALFISLIIGR